MGNGDSNIRFNDLYNLALDLGFNFQGWSGSHVGFYNPTICESLNLQKTKDGKAKPYQAKQLRQIINMYNL